MTSTSSVAVFNCCITNFLKRRSLKQPSYIYCPDFCGPLGSLLEAPETQMHVLVEWVLTERPRGDLGEIRLQTRVFGRIHFLVAVGLRTYFLAGCQPLSASGGHPHLLPYGPPIFKSAVENLPLILSHLVCPVNLSHFLFRHQPENKRSAFKGPTCLGRAHLMSSLLPSMGPNHRRNTRGQGSWEPFKKSAHLTFIPLTALRSKQN